MLCCESVASDKKERFIDSQRVDVLLNKVRLTSVSGVAAKLKDDEKVDDPMPILLVDVSR
jgi:hypothetical protein